MYSAPNRVSQYVRIHAIILLQFYSQTCASKKKAKK